MGRGVLDAVVLFLSPFVAYGMILALRRRCPFVAASWSRGCLGPLTIAGLAMAVLGLIVLGAVAGRHGGAYVPAHIEGGRLVPGSIQ